MRTRPTHVALKRRSQLVIRISLSLTHVIHSHSSKSGWVDTYFFLYFQHYLNRALEQNEKRMSNEYSVTTLAVLSRVEFPLLCELGEN